MELRRSLNHGGICRPDVIEIDSWIARVGKNGMRRDWVVRRYETNEVLVRATRYI